jgi:hypothetical protein
VRSSHAHVVKARCPFHKFATSNPAERL